MATNPSMVVRIAASLDELKRNIAEGRNQVEVLTAGMQKLAASLDGSKLEQRAHNITAAINEIGGVSKLTDGEARRLVATLDAYVQKAERMGDQVPTAIRATRDELRQVVDTADRAQQGTAAWIEQAKGWAATLGIAFSAQAVISFVGHVFDAASQIGDLSQQLGISVEAVQGFKFAAEQSGTTLDVVSVAITKMNEKLAAGDKGTVSALKSAGLAFDAIRAMKPEDAFLAITDAIQRVPDPMERSRLALELFGKSGAQLLPAIMDGFRGVSDSASKMSADTIRELKAAQDAWSALGNKVVIVTGGMIAGVVEMTKHLSENRDNLVQYLKDLNQYGIVAATLNAMRQQAQENAAAAAHDINLALDVNPVDAYKQHLKELQIGIGDLTSEKQKLVLQAHDLGESLADIAKGLHLEEAVVNLVIEAQKREAEQANRTAQANAQAVEQTTRLWSEYNTLRVQQGGTATDVQIAQIKQWADEVTARMKKLGADTTEFYKALAAVSAQKMAMVEVDWQKYSNYSRAHLQEIADREQALYIEMELHAGDFSRNAILYQREVARQAIQAAQAWADPWEAALDRLLAHSEGAAQKFTATWNGVVGEGKTAAQAMANAFDNAVAQIVKRQTQLEELKTLSTITYDLSTPEGLAQFRKLNPSATINVGTDYFKTHTLQDAIAAGLVDLYAGFKTFLQTMPNVPYLAGGASNFGGGLAVVGERGPELVRLPAGSDVIPNGAAFGGVTINVSVNGSIIGDDRDRVAAELGNAIMTRLRGMGQRFPVTRKA